MGYWQAGFQPVGLDSSPQRLLRYPFPKFKADVTLLDGEELVALALRALGAGRRRGPVLAHASPPCPSYSVLRHLGNRDPSRPPPDRLIRLVRMLLQEANLTYVIENVEEARPHLLSPVRLCGSSDPFRLRVRRHRLFRALTRDHAARLPL